MEEEGGATCAERAEVKGRGAALMALSTDDSAQEEPRLFLDSHPVRQPI